MRRILASVLAVDRHEVVEAEGVLAAQRAFAGSPFDLVLTDQRMSDGDGLALLASCREVDATVPVVVMTAFATVELAVEAMKLGAFDFVTKPFVPEAVRAVVRRACERTELVRENERLRGPGPPARAAFGAARREPRHAGHPRPDRPGRPDQRHRTHPRRDRHGQGARGPGDPRRPARGPSARSSRSTAPASPRRCSRASCSATSAARSPARTGPGRASSRPRTGARSSSTRRGRCRCRCRPSSCAS